MSEFKPLSLEDGIAAVRFARSVVESRLGLTRNLNPLTSTINTLRLGVWVTIEKIINDAGVMRRVVRGSMGSPIPMNRLPMDLALVSEYAAFNDPRFSPLTSAELDHCIFEVTLVGNMRETKLSEFNEFVPGRHGLLIKIGRGTKVILPQTLVEAAIQRRNGEPFKNRDELHGFICTLIGDKCGEKCEACNGSAYIYDTQIFYELEPGGRVVERMIYRNKLFTYINQKS
ncbi:MAG: AMMECR1 domain-containing protein [Thermocladium sp.]|jgi:uncharacterized protein (TIGR00296 family)